MRRSAAPCPAGAAAAACGSAGTGAAPAGNEVSGLAWLADDAAPLTAAEFAAAADGSPVALAIGLLLNRAADIPAAPAAPGLAAALFWAAACGEAGVAPVEVAGVPLAPVAAVIVRFAAGWVAARATGVACVTAFAVVEQPPADSFGSSSQVEKLAAAPVWQHPQS